MPKRNPIWREVFIAEYLKNGQNAALAYRMAKPNVTLRTSEVESVKLLSKPEFKELLEVQRAKASEKIEMSKDEWFKLLNDEARFDLRKYLKCEAGSGDLQLADDWQTRSDGHAIEHLKFQTTTLESGQVVQRVEMKAASKQKAKEMIGKALGYLDGDKMEAPGGLEFQKQLLMTLATIRELAAKDPKILDISSEEVQRVAQLKVIRRT